MTFWTKVCLLFMMLLIITSAFAQEKFTISGYVKDSATGEDLVGAVISVKQIQQAAVETNSYGFYSITLPQAAYNITAQYLGYKSKSLVIHLNKDKSLSFSLNQQSNELNQIEISAEKNNENVTSTTMGVQKLNIKDLKTIPVIFGEQDIMKTIQLLPGIVPVGDGSSGFYVRGSASDQNLVLLDEATIYNPSHLLGFFSVFNSDAIKDVTVYKDAIPAQFGGRLASVIDLEMNEGNDKNYVVHGGIGLIASHLSVEGPFDKGRGSFIVSARRTYADLFLKLSKDTTLNKSRLYFYDLNAKANYKLNNNNRVYLSGYLGRDILGFGSEFGLSYGNDMAAFRWNHLYSDKLFSNTSLIFTNYDDIIQIGIGDLQFHLLSRIQDYEIKQDFQLFPDTKNNILFGFSSVYHRIIPGLISDQGDIKLVNTTLNNKYAWDNALYASDKFKANDKLSLEAGIRLSFFSLLGPGDFYNYNSDGTILDTMKYGPNKFVKTYFNPEPRLSLTYLLNEESSLKASYSRNTQNLHLIQNSTSENPTDVWIPSSNFVKPEISDQVSFGYFRNFKENNFVSSAEVYYKNMYNQIAYKPLSELNLNTDIESELLFGKAKAYGLELFFKKKFGKLNGWIGYTLSRVEEQVPGLNNGNYFPARQDVTNDISIVGMYQLNKKWSFSATWVYYSGNPVTFPNGKYEVADNIIFEYTNYNGYRMPPYHRLDIGATYTRKKTAKKESSWTFSVYNVYDHNNPYSITFRQNPDNPSETQAVQTTLFKIVPSITYNFKF